MRSKKKNAEYFLMEVMNLNPGAKGFIYMKYLLEYHETKEFSTFYMNDMYKILNKKFKISATQGERCLRYLFDNNGEKHQPLKRNVAKTIFRFQSWDGGEKNGQKYKIGTN